MGVRQEAAPSQGTAEDPADPLAAVTHPDPYPYYARLVAERPFHRDEALGLWVASGADAVGAVLGNPQCRVRPSAEAVPEALMGSTAGELFRALVRMSDGGRQHALKTAVVSALDGIDAQRLAVSAERWAAQLAAGISDGAGAAPLSEFAFALPVHVLGDLLGIAGDRHDELGALVGALVRCLFPGGTRAEIERGKAAVGPLLQLVETRLDSARPSEAPLLQGLAAHARAQGDDIGERVAANAIGLLAQAHDATAALIAATLLALARRPDLAVRVARAPELLEAVVEEVVRFDAPVQNTRRFVAEEAVVAGRTLRAGDCVLVVLAAANRDARANTDPEAFDPARRSARVFTFGLGAHACPGRRLAVAIAAAGVRQLLARGIDPQRLDVRPPFRPSTNCRMPLVGISRTIKEES